MKDAKGGDIRLVNVKANDIFKLVLAHTALGEIRLFMLTIVAKIFQEYR